MIKGGKNRVISIDYPTEIQKLVKPTKSKRIRKKRIKALLYKVLMDYVKDEKNNVSI